MIIVFWFRYNAKSILVSIRSVQMYLCLDTKCPNVFWFNVGTLHVSLYIFIFCFFLCCDFFEHIKMPGSRRPNTRSNRRINPINRIPVRINEKEYYEIEEILPQVVVKWKGFPVAYNSLEPLENLDRCPEVVEKFISKFINSSQILFQQNADVQADNFHHHFQPPLANELNNNQNLNIINSSSLITKEIESNNYKSTATTNKGHRSCNNVPRFIIVCPICHENIDEKIYAQRGKYYMHWRFGPGQPMMVHYRDRHKGSVYPQTHEDYPNRIRLTRDQLKLYHVLLKSTARIDPENKDVTKYLTHIENIL